MSEELMTVSEVTASWAQLYFPWVWDQKFQNKLFPYIGVYHLELFTSLSCLPSLAVFLDDYSHGDCASLDIITQVAILAIQGQTYYSQPADCVRRKPRERCLLAPRAIKDVEKKLGENIQASTMDYNQDLENNRFEAVNRDLL